MALFLFTPTLSSTLDAAISFRTLYFARYFAAYWFIAFAFFYSTPLPSIRSISHRWWDEVYDVSAPPSWYAYTAAFSLTREYAAALRWPRDALHCHGCRRHFITPQPPPTDWDGRVDVAVTIAIFAYAELYAAPERFYFQSHHLSEIDYRRHDTTLSRPRIAWDGGHPAFFDAFAILRHAIAIRLAWDFNIYHFDAVFFWYFAALCCYIYRQGADISLSLTPRVFRDSATMPPPFATLIAPPPPMSSYSLSSFFLFFFRRWCCFLFALLYFGPRFSSSRFHGWFFASAHCLRAIAACCRRWCRCRYLPDATL